MISTDLPPPEPLTLEVSHEMAGARTILEIVLLFGLGLGLFAALVAAALLLFFLLPGLVAGSGSLSPPATVSGSAQVLSGAQPATDTPQATATATLVVPAGVFTSEPTQTPADTVQPSPVPTSTPLPSATPPPTARPYIAPAQPRPPIATATPVPTATPAYPYAFEGAPVLDHSRACQAQLILYGTIHDRQGRGLSGVRLRYLPQYGRNPDFPAIARGGAEAGYYELTLGSAANEWDLFIVDANDQPQSAAIHVRVERTDPGACWWQLNWKYAGP